MSENQPTVYDLSGTSPELEISDLRNYTPHAISFLIDGKIVEIPSSGCVRVRATKPEDTYIGLIKGVTVLENPEFDQLEGDTQEFYEAKAVIVSGPTAEYLKKTKIRDMVFTPPLNKKYEFRGPNGHISYVTGLTWFC